MNCHIWQEIIQQLNAIFLKLQQSEMDVKEFAMSEALDKLLNDHYTTEQVAQAVGRKPEHWCRLRHKYAAKFGLEVVKLGRRHYYKKEPVNKMIDELLKNGD